MVQTRHQWNTWAERGFRNTQSSQGSNNSYSYSQPSNGSDHGMGTANADRDLYSPNDHCKRHRREDGEPKTEEVVSYRRRVAK